MARDPKAKEGWPFFVCLVLLGCGTIWNAAGGGFQGFGHIWDVVAQTPPTSFDELGTRLERLVRLPQPVKFPEQKIVPPPEIAASKKAMERLPGPRPPLAQLGGEGKKNPFFPPWAQEMLREMEVSVEPGPDVAAGAGKGNPDKTKGPVVVEDPYIFAGIVKVRDEPPAAVLRDVTKQVSVFLKEGDKYGPIRAVKVDLGGATFQVQGQTQYSFDTLHSSNKTFTVRRTTGGT